MYSYNPPPILSAAHPSVFQNPTICPHQPAGLHNSAFYNLAQPSVVHTPCFTNSTSTLQHSHPQKKTQYAAKLFNILNQLNQITTPYLFYLESYPSSNPDLKIYEWRHHHKFSLNLIATLLNLLQMKDLNEFSQILTRYLDEKSCELLIASLSQDNFDSDLSEIADHIIQAIQKSNVAPHAYLIKEFGSGMLKYSSIIMKTSGKNKKYIYLNPFKEDGSAQEISLRQENAEQMKADLQLFIQSINQKRVNIQEIPIQGWGLYKMSPKHSHSYSFGADCIIQENLLNIKTSAINLQEFSSFKSLFSHFSDHNYLFSSLIKIGLNNKTTINITLWQQNTNTCLLATFLNTFQVNDLAKLGESLDQSTSLKNKEDLLYHLKNMPTYGMDAKYLKILAKNMPRNSNSRQFAIYQKFQNLQKNHFLGMWTQQINQTKYYILVDSVMAYKPCVIYNGECSYHLTQRLNTLLKPPSCNKYFDDFIEYELHQY